MFQVNRVEAHYDKTSKQVDVNLLKGALWDQIQEVVRVPEMVIIFFLPQIYHMLNDTFILELLIVHFVMSAMHYIKGP